MQLRKNIVMNVLYSLYNTDHFLVLMLLYKLELYYFQFKNKIILFLKIVN